jgi:hypothetical protein
MSFWRTPVTRSDSCETRKMCPSNVWLLEATVTIGMRCLHLVEMECMVAVLGGPSSLPQVNSFVAHA